MATLDDFGRRMRRRADNIPERLNQRVRRIAMAVLTELVVSTPVDTGRARSNWHVGLGAPPDSGNEEPYHPGEDGSTDAANARAAIAVGQAALSDRRPEQDVYISNNLPYIARLNEGWSAQAPAGFVQTAVANGMQSGSSGKPITGD